MLIAKLHEFPDRAIEWLLGLILLTWGVVVLTNPGLFETNAVYAGWRRILDSQAAWGIFAITCGASRVVALYINGAHRRTPVVRVFTAFLSMFVWFWVVAGMLSVGVTTGLAVYPWLMVGEAFSVYRASGDVYKAGEGARLSVARN